MKQIIININEGEEFIGYYTRSSDGLNSYHNAIKDCGFCRHKHFEFENNKLIAYCLGGPRLRTVFDDHDDAKNCIYYESRIVKE